MSFKETQLIKCLRRLSKTGSGVVVGIGDDTAVLPLDKTWYRLWTQDTVVETIHFKKGARPEDIGWKALARNISDIAAMGGMSEYALVSIGVPRTYNLARCLRVYRGMDRLAKQFGVRIIGGDTVASPALFLTVSVVGKVEKKNLMLRSGARPGDAILCTGTLGGSIDGKHLKFMPRQKEARWLVKNFKINAMIDISDGLAGDLGHIMKESGCGALLYKDQIPVSTALRQRRMSQDRRVKRALSDGEDYELLFTASPDQARGLVSKARQKGIALTIMGEILKGPSKIFVRDSFGRRVEIKFRGFEHIVV